MDKILFLALGFWFTRKDNLGENSTEGGIGQRLRSAVRTRAKASRYWLAVSVLSGMAILSIVVFGFRSRGYFPFLSEPAVPRPGYQITSVLEMPVGRQQRLTVTALIRPELGPESLRAVLDWILFSVLDEYNRIRRRKIQVVWVYLYEDTTSSLASWRAMAVYVDPKLSGLGVPDAARIGGDAIKDGAVEYDFTNPVKDAK